QPAGTRLWILAPVVRGRKGAHRKLLQDLARQGYVRALVDGALCDLDEPPRLASGRRHEIAVVVDGLVNRPGVKERLSEALARAVGLSDGTVLVRTGDGGTTLYSREAGCPSCGRSFAPLEPRLFSFNSPTGSCPACQGLGSQPTISVRSLVPDPGLTLGGGAVSYLRGKESGWLYTQVEAFAGALGFSMHTPWGELAETAREVLLHGMSPEIEASLREHKHYDAFLRDWAGLVPELLRRHRETRSDKVRSGISSLLTAESCPVCDGYRLCADALSVRVDGLHLGEVGELALTDLLSWFAGLSFTEPVRIAVAKPILEQITARVRFLCEVGVGYLSLSRGVGSLSGGEGQRVRLATQVGSRLTGVLYILDEPSVGLHHRDIHRLIGILGKLRDRGNSVVVVEHDLDIMLAADHLLDLGPGAGEHGGEIVAQGTPAEVAANLHSITGSYLAGRQGALGPVPVAGGAEPEAWLRMHGLTNRNLKGIDLEIPLGRLTLITGVSGSGKSTAIHDTLYRELARRLHRAGAESGPFVSLEGDEALRSVILVDQSPIGRSPRSTPATYTGLMGHLRKLYAATTLAKIRGYGAGRFSFNTSSGRCPICEGAGVKRLSMDFLPDVDVPCEVCSGQRYDPETLEVRFKGRNVADVLAMTVEEALALLGDIPSCRKILAVMDGVGLGYLRLGQAGATLSGGEAQRLKLSRELARGNGGNSLYILDEPTTGLHFCDVDRLMDILARLTGRGHTVIVIEHNPEVIRRADWVIDLGPEGGEEGGRVVAQGTLETILAARGSYTGEMLRGLAAPRS
ncbi:excinuclease ABC subunit UvrA, partial [bacterium]|nr:excinuclease ABC subunit UvrA [bacterium]